METVRKKVVLSIFLIVFNSLLALNSQSDFNLETSVFFSCMQGQVDELVYTGLNDNPYLSALYWDLKPAMLIGLRGSYKKADSYVINMSLGFAIPVSTGFMEDYDWIYPSIPNAMSDWSHWSKSSIMLLFGFSGHIEAARRVWHSEENSLFLNVGGGLRFDTWSWEDSIVDNIYSVSGFRDSEDTLAVGVNGINYSVYYFLPYLWAELMWEKSQIQLIFDMRISIYPVVFDQDYHILRDIHFNSVSNPFPGLIIMPGLSIRYNLEEDQTGWFLQAGIKGLFTPFELVGDSTYQESSGTSYSENAAGFSYENIEITVAIGYTIF